MKHTGPQGLFAKPMTRKQFLGIGALAVASLFGVGGIVKQLTSHAATPFVAAEPEAGTATAGATIITDTTASGGKAVKFAAAPAPPPTPTPAPTGNFKPDWSDEFNGTSLSYATSDTSAGTWRTNGYGGLGGNSDAASPTTWDGNMQQLTQYGIVTVANSIMTITCKRSPLIPGVNNAWVGASLCTNFAPVMNNSTTSTASGGTGLTWRYGYFEWRASIPNPCAGMFPALWMFNNVASRNNGYQGAEIDLLEIFGDASGQPWEGGIHWNPGGYNGSTGQNVVTAHDDTTGWHRYAIEWTPTAINYLKDGVVRGSMTGGGATWFNHADLGIRIDYVMDNTKTSSGNPPSGFQPKMLVDYVRYYKTKPANLPTGSADPTL